MSTRNLSSYRYALHGLAVEVASSVDFLDSAVRRLLGPFLVQSWPDGFNPISGTILPFDEAEVTRHLSSKAAAFSPGGFSLELYRDGERFWLVDERWGICEINLLKGQWRSWILPSPTTDPYRCAEMAILWPLAQLARGRGLHLLPAASIARHGWAALLVSQMGIEPELRMLINAGFKIIGQHWTALREEDGRIALLHFPGQVERVHAPRLRITSSGHTEMHEWIDLLENRATDIRQHHAFCDSVILIEPGRRTQARHFEIESTQIAETLQRSWPTFELHPTRRQSRLAAKLATSCRCAEIFLSRNPADLLPILYGIQDVAMTPWYQQAERVEQTRFSEYRIEPTSLPPFIARAG